jgi:hypothetical protein
MLASYQKPKSFKPKPVPTYLLPTQTRTLSDLLTLYTDGGSTQALTTKAEDELQTYTMALAADGVDKTLAM